MKHPRFVNTDGSRNPHHLGTVLRWKLGLHNEAQRTPGRADVPVVANDGKALRGADPALTWVGHATYLAQLGGRSMLLDPVWATRLAVIRHSGDTAWFDGFAEIGRRVGKIHAAMLPIGAYAPRWFMRTQHIDPHEAVRAFEQLGAEHFVAMHWGTFKLTDEALDEPPQRLREVWQARGLPSSRQHILPIGGMLKL